MLYYKYGANKYFLPQTYKALYQKSEAKAKTLAADAWSFLTSLNGVLCEGLHILNRGIALILSSLYCKSLLTLNLGVACIQH